MDENKTSVVEDIGKVGVAAAIFVAIDYYLGEIWLFIMLGIGIYGVKTATNMSISGLRGMIEKSGGSPKVKETWEAMWYNANVPPQSDERMANPTAEQISEYIRWREEQEKAKAKESEGSPKEETKAS